MFAVRRTRQICKKIYKNTYLCPNEKIDFFFLSLQSSHWKFGFGSQAAPFLHYSRFNFSNSVLFFGDVFFFFCFCFFSRIQLMCMCGGCVFLCTLVLHAEILEEVYWKRKILFLPLSRSFNRITKMTYFMNAQIIYIYMCVWNKDHFKCFPLLLYGSIKHLI